MSTTRDSAPRALPSDFYIASPLQFAIQVGAIVLRRLRIRSDRRQLESMPDYLLHDLGITRGEIDRVTNFGRDGRANRRA